MLAIAADGAIQSVSLTNWRRSQLRRQDLDLPAEGHTISNVLPPVTMV
jgi:hypothetical protein